MDQKKAPYERIFSTMRQLVFEGLPASPYVLLCITRDGWEYAEIGNGWEQSTPIAGEEAFVQIEQIIRFPLPPKLIERLVRADHGWLHSVYHVTWVDCPHENCQARVAARRIASTDTEFGASYHLYVDTHERSVNSTNDGRVKGDTCPASNTQVYKPIE